MVAKTKKDTLVTEPVVTLRLNRYHTEEVFVLSTEHEYFLLGRGEPMSRRRYGPALVIRKRIGSKTETTASAINGANWKYIANLMTVGAWALNSKPVAALMTDDMANLSPRFAGSTKAQRKALVRKKRR